MHLLSGVQEKSASWITASVLTLTQDVVLDKGRALNQKPRELSGNTMRNPQCYTPSAGYTYTCKSAVAGGSYPPAASGKDNYLWEETPVQEAQSEFIPLQGICVLNWTLPNMHSNSYKNLFSAEPDKWADRKHERNPLWLISDSERYGQ